MAKGISLEDFEKLLKEHDWYFEMADDQRAWSAGVKTWEEIKKHKDTSPLHKELYEKYLAKYQY